MLSVLTRDVVKRYNESTSIAYAVSFHYACGCLVFVLHSFESHIDIQHCGAVRHRSSSGDSFSRGARGKIGD